VGKTCQISTFVLQVIEVRASRRTGADDFVRSVKMSLRGHYGDKPIGLGGVFLVQKGSAHIHIMVQYFVLFNVI